MVNVKNTTKKQILSMLRENSTPLSGEYMSDRIGISRVAVWKQIKSLREMGYTIEGSASGYSLNDDIDHLYSWEFKTERDNYFIFKSLDSTMDLAREKAENGCSPYTTIIAETQNRGKGSTDRIWISEEGGLYFTTILRPELPSSYHYIYTLAATAALKESVKKLYNISTDLKWPNDLMHHNKKIAGVLTEMNIKGNYINWLNVGVGINVNNNMKHRLEISEGSSIKEISGSSHDRKDLLTSFEKNFRKIIEHNTPEEIRNLWMKGNESLKKDLTLKPSTGKILRGRSEGIDESGALLIKDRDNIQHKALFGDIYYK